MSSAAPALGPTCPLNIFEPFTYILQLKSTKLENNRTKVCPPLPVVLGGVWAGSPAEAPQLEQVEHVDPRHQRPALLLAAGQQSSVQTLHQLLLGGSQSISSSEKRKHVG